MLSEERQRVMREKKQTPPWLGRKGIFLQNPLSLWLRNVIGLVLLGPLIIACDHQIKKATPVASAAQKHIFPEKVTVKYAKGFTVAYHGSYKVVNILNHFEDQVDTLRYVLVPRGITPAISYPNAQVIQIPVRRMVGMSSMHVALVDFLESAEVLAGLGNLKYVSSAGVRKNITAGKVKEVGKGEEVNEELLITMQPDLLMATGSPDAKFSRYNTLMDAGIPVLMNSEWLETTPLGRAEWVKLMAVLLNKEALVNQKFGQLEKEYHRLAALTQKATIKPSIITGMPFKGTWSVPDGDSYMARFLQDAGTTYHWAKVQGKGSLHLDFERVAPVALQADFWLNVGYVDSKEDIVAKDVRFKDFRPFRQGAIYNNNKRVNDIGSNDYWESGAVNPHLILADLIKILHPELLPQHKLVYYKQLR